MTSNPYLENMVANANPVRLVIMLYEKAIACLENVLEIGDTEDFDTQRSKYEEMGRALEIISLLNATLDMEKGGEIAKNLREIYNALMDELTYQMLKEDKERLERVVKILKDLKSSWEEVERIRYGKGQKVAPGV
ncbi:flagellar export chaperone FliS [Thermocrinis sp.]